MADCRVASAGLTNGEAQSDFELLHAQIAVVRPHAAAMTGLAPCIGRAVAHDRVYDICRVAFKDERHSLVLLDRVLAQRA